MPLAFHSLLSESEGNKIKTPFFLLIPSPFTNADRLFFFSSTPLGGTQINKHKDPNILWLVGFTAAVEIICVLAESTGTPEFNFNLFIMLLHL